MSRTKGSEKTGGREKGTPNRVTTDLRIFINDLLNNNRQQLIKDMKKLEPQQRVGFYEKLLGYVIPKMSSIDAAVELNNLTDAQLDAIISGISKQIENE